MHTLACEALFEAQTNQLTYELLASRGWEIMDKKFPTLVIAFHREGRKSIRLHFKCDNWNAEPPAISLLDGQGQPLTAVPAGGSGIFNAGPHSKRPGPFICMAGSREYHTHESHINDKWDNYKLRPGYDLGGLLTQIWNGWLSTNP